MIIRNRILLKLPILSFCFREAKENGPQEGALVEDSSNRVSSYAICTVENDTMEKEFKYYI